MKKFQLLNVSQVNTEEYKSKKLIKKYLDDFDEHLDNVPACIILNIQKCRVWNFKNAENK